MQLERIIPEELAGLRLDQALARLFDEYSRARLQKWIKGGHVKLDGAIPSTREAVHGGQHVTVTPQLEAQASFEPERIAIDVVHEDGHILVINKPAGLVTHPAAGNWRGTLLNGLLHHAPELSKVPRAGIVHRLDKHTSGLMLVARTVTAHKRLVEQLQAREIRREYLALVHGEVVAGGTVEGAIGRHPVDRKRMAVVHNGKPALTHYRIEARYQGYTLLRVSLETGRTHQIRVHTAHIRHPVVGDPVYGGRARVAPGMSDEAKAAVQGFRRQALHAAKLGLAHPESGANESWAVPMPQDMQTLCKTVADRPT